MIDIAAETLIPIYQAPAVLPGRPSLPTVWRWVLRGCRGVVLDSVVIGGRRYVSHEGVARFAAASTARASGQTEAPPIRTSAAREKAILRAEKIVAGR